MDGLLGCFYFLNVKNHAVVHCTIAKTCQQTECPSMDEWIKKMRCVYIYTHTVEYYSAIENEIIPFAATWMGLEIVILSAVSHPEKDKY